MNLATCLQKNETGWSSGICHSGSGRCTADQKYQCDPLMNRMQFSFLLQEAKNFCKELMDDGRVQILCYTKYKEMIRMSGKACAVAEEEQEKWMNRIFEEQPYLANVYPGDTRKIGIVFCIDRAEIEYFHLGVNPIFRETYSLGNATIKKKGYYITKKMHWMRKLSGKMSAEMYHEGDSLPD